MAQIPAADFVTLTDSLGVMADEFLAINELSAVTDLQAEAAANVQRVLDLTDPKAVATILPGFNAFGDNLAAPLKTLKNVFDAAVAALLSNTGALATYLATNNIMLSPGFAALLRAMNGATAVGAQYVFPPAAVSLATFTVTGAGAGTFGAASAVDTTLYGAVQCEVETTHTIGGTSVVATLTMVKFDGTTEQKTVTIPNGSASGVKVSIGTSTDKYKDCSAITITGGTATDAFKVQNKILRVPSV